MTDLQKLYLQARAGGRRSHHGALRDISLSTGLDVGTVDRCLKRARRTDDLEAKKGES